LVLKATTPSKKDLYNEEEFAKEKLYLGLLLEKPYPLSHLNNYIGKVE
jgi:hypothetical protein